LAGKLVQLLRDESGEVRRYAVESAGRLKKREYVSELIFCLKDPATRTEAAEALAKYGERILGTLEDYLRDSAEQQDIRRAIPQILAKVPTQESVDILLRALGEAGVAAEAIDALDRIRTENKEINFSGVDVRKKIDAGIKACCQIVLEPEGQAACSRKLEPSPEQQKAMDDHLAEIFKLMGLIFPQEDMAKAFQNWRAGDRNSVAYAIELLDNALDRPAKEKLLPLIEDIPCEERARKCRSLIKSLA
jgi:HEAT repeat protein